MPQRAAAVPREASRGQANRRFAFLFTLFAVLSVAGFAWLLRGDADTAAVWRSLGQQPWWFYVLVAAASALLIAAEVLRVMVHAWAIGVAMPARTAFDATIANNFMSWLSPGGLLGEPAATYVMARYGTPVDAALLIAYVKFVISFAFILGLAGAGITLGYSPPFPMTLTVSLISGIGLFVSLLALLVGGAMWPTQSRAWLHSWHDRGARTWLGRGRRGAILSAMYRTADDSVARLSALRARDARWLVPVLLSHIGYYCAYAGIMLAVAYGLAPNANVADTELVMRGFVYLGFLHILPTPGGTALGEIAAHAFFVSTFGRGLDVQFVIWFRIATLYAHVGFGLFYLPAIGVWRGVLSRRLWGSSKNVT